MQETFHRAGTRQVQLDPILVLHHPHRQLEQFQDERHRLRANQFRVAQGVIPQAANQPLGSAGADDWPGSALDQEPA